MTDDRVLCATCRHYRFGVCRAADGPGVVWGGVQIPPEIRDVPLRCTAYFPTPDQADQRRGAVRWPLPTNHNPKAVNRDRQRR